MTLRVGIGNPSFTTDEKLGLSEDRKLIFLATKSPNSFPWNKNIIEIIASAIRENRLALPCQLLVRLHPIHFKRKNGNVIYGDILNGYSLIEGRNDIVFFDTPTILSQYMHFDMPGEEMIKVASLLMHSDILVNMFSTMMLEASILDVPIVNVAFYSHDTRLGERNLSATTYSHIKRIIETGGVRVAESEDQLIQIINRYLLNPELDCTERAHIRTEECGPFPGSAGKRIGNHVLDLLASEGRR